MRNKQAKIPVYFCAAGGEGGDTRLGSNMPVGLMTSGAGTGFGLGGVTLPSGTDSSARVV